MPKIILFSDLHIHHHSSKIEKLNDCLKCFEWVYAEAVKRKIPYIIFAGDLFHDRQKINIYAYDRTYEILQKYSKDVQSFYILGNHDIYFRTKRSSSSVRPFSEIINVIENPCTINIEGVNIDFLPYTENPSLDIKNNFDELSDVLVGHLALSGATLNSSRNIKYRTSDLTESIRETPRALLDKYKRVFLGHFHARQQISKTIEYIGSPLQLSYGEAYDKKGFTILNLKTLKTEFVENKFTPQYYIISIDEDISKYNLKDNYVRIISSQASAVNEIDFKNDIIKKFGPKELEIIHVTTEEEEIKINEEINKIEHFAKNISETIDQYVGSADIELDKKKLIDIGIKIIQQED